MSGFGSSAGWRGLFALYIALSALFQPLRASVLLAIAGVVEVSGEFFLLFRLLETAVLGGGSQFGWPRCPLGLSSGLGGS